ncbi:hypothetical protein ZHAS_00007307 [Anopheles sinensis]|uniref:Uncharacterized protein n=1 Tax=Anopheles sinensis TaxID=74873 RepID=A0A084VPN2_ANOSI|nr:hypothetical protein ZHAS_00007307 [Anopheles sinensis]
MCRRLRTSDDIVDKIAAKTESPPFGRLVGWWKNALRKEIARMTHSSIWPSVRVHHDTRTGCGPTQRRTRGRPPHMGKPATTMVVWSKCPSLRCALVLSVCYVASVRVVGRYDLP